MFYVIPVAQCNVGRDVEMLKWRRQWNLLQGQCQELAFDNDHYLIYT